MRFLLIVFLLLSSAAHPQAVKPPFLSPPAEFSSLSDLQQWVQENKGFGGPESTESNLAGIHLFAAWNCPYSGRKANYIYTYRWSKPAGKWLLLDFSEFERPEPVNFVYFDSRAQNVVYVGNSGRVLKKISFRQFRFK